MHEFQYNKVGGVGDASPLSKKSWGTPSPRVSVPLQPWPILTEDASSWCCGVGGRVLEGRVVCGSDVFAPRLPSLAAQNDHFSLSLADRRAVRHFQHDRTEPHTHTRTRTGWRRGVVVSSVRRMNEVNARRARLVPDRLRTCIPSRKVTGQLGQLSLASRRCRLIEYELRLR